MNNLEEKLIKNLLGVDIKTLYQTLSVEIFNSVKAFIENVEKENLTNEQWFIDWEIEMNKLTVKDHNKSNN